MAYCKVAAIPGGGVAMVRFSGRPPERCDFCKTRYHTRLCDALVGRKTCDAKMCDSCGVKSGKNDFCPAHKEFA